MSYPPAKHHFGTLNHYNKRPGPTTAHDGYFYIRHQTHRGEPAVEPPPRFYSDQLDCFAVSDRRQCLCLVILHSLPFRFSAFAKFFKPVHQIVTVFIFLRYKFDKTQQPADNFRSKCVLGFAGGLLGNIRFDT